MQERLDVGLTRQAFLFSLTVPTVARSCGRVARLRRSQVSCPVDDVQGSGYLQKSFIVRHQDSIRREGMSRE